MNDQVKIRICFFYSYLVLAYTLFLTGASLSGYLVFGHGLADILYHPVVWLLTLINVCSFAINRKAPIRLMIVSLVLSLPIILISLKATYWRGAEYRWNGNFFYTSQNSSSLFQDNLARLEYQDWS